MKKLMICVLVITLLMGLTWTAHAAEIPDPERPASLTLEMAPCRYYGSIGGEDLVLMAHNYASHFGRIDELRPGDTVCFTDMDGISTWYQVTVRDLLPPTAVEEMTSGGSDLTLFTCTYGGRTRTGFEPPFVSKTASLRVKRRFDYVNDTKY